MKLLFGLIFAGSLVLCTNGEVQAMEQNLNSKEVSVMNQYLNIFNIIPTKVIHNDNLQKTWCFLDNQLYISYDNGKTFKELYTFYDGNIVDFQIIGEQIVVVSIEYYDGNSGMQYSIDFGKTFDTLIDVQTTSQIAYENVKEIPVLLYHDFHPTNLDYATVLYEDFIDQLDYLQTEGYNTITVDDLYKISTGKQIMPENPIIICADDGYMSSYSFMYPELKKRNMNATIFVIGKSLDRASNGEFISERGRFTWDQAKEMVQNDVIDIQLHTFDSHYETVKNNEPMGIFATPFEYETEEDYCKRIDFDIKQNIIGIENHLGYTPVAFAYPYGSYSELSEDILKQNDIKFTFTTNHGALELDEEFYLIDRLIVGGTETFEAFVRKVKN
ncbi:hypothetical protein AN640_06945 [Candidatus Epulonipiscium fishelsonii]|uniref:Uncharacterized protein n=1 Tax=Candidatus Epulonipiscium fishelsonii TaxID=77094 RepID=A0ACC8XH42_9FIRM|nr:hypothetical protein AN640_06945 [Epulopiscium sp. SCG-D08WGA-EpuloA1]OON94397.1 MAG: hypothetical protein ATN32_08265 [Epulopiscium sp. AS2M-Bin002]